MLWKLANLNTRAQAREFLGMYGELESALDESGYLSAANIFRNAWRAATARQKEIVTIALTHLLGTLFDEKRDSVMDGPIEVLRMPAIIPDFTSGRISLKPRNLLDWLVQSLLECRNNLAICERKDCSTRYFIKSHPRQRFCSAPCADTVRETKKKAWWAENGERFR